MLTNYKHVEIPKITGKLENVTAAENSDAKFTIRIGGGKPKPAIVWFIEEMEVVTTDERYEVAEVEDSVTLTIRKVKSEDAVSYYAKLVNEAGSVNSNKATLTVNSTIFFL